MVKNPIIPGFAPDPSVIQIGDTFFLVNSSFHIFPGLPIYASKNLETWTHIGNAINRPNQLSLSRSITRIYRQNDDYMLSTGGLYAPTIRYHNKKVYIVCTNAYRHAEDESKDESQNFIVTTDDIWSNQWSDPIYFEHQGIDPSLFFDDDNRAYVQGCRIPDFTIVQMEIDVNTGKLLSATKEIWKGDKQEYTEGPHVYKKDGYYYLVVAEGGTFMSHMVCAARSKNIWGPYESYQHNPILTAHGTDVYIQHTGHCDIFQAAADGRWWAVMLGVRKNGDSFTMGRESFLTSVDWQEGGWPSMDIVKPSIAISPSYGQTELEVSGDSGFVYIRDIQEENYKIAPDGKEIVLLPSKVDFSQALEPVTFVGKRQRLLEGKSTVEMHVPVASSQLQSGIALYKDEHRHISIFYDSETSEVKFRAVNDASRRLSILNKFPLQVNNSSSIRFSISHTELQYQFWFQHGDDDAELLAGEIKASDITDYDFVGPVIGIFATGKSLSGDKVEVLFKNLEIQ